MHAWTPLVALHALGACWALALGAVVLLHRRRGDLLHRRLGRLWTAAMAWTVVSSFGIRVLTPGRFSWIHALSAWTGVCLVVAVVAARTGRRALHAQFVVGAYLGLVGAGVAAAGVPGRLVPELVADRPGTALLGAAAVLAATGLAVLALRPRRRQRRLVAAATRA